MLKVSYKVSANRRTSKATSTKKLFEVGDDDRTKPVRLRPLFEDLHGGQARLHPTYGRLRVGGTQDSVKPISRSVAVKLVKLGNHRRFIGAMETIFEKLHTS